MNIVERICLAWRAASDGDYVAWEDIPEDATVKIKERQQVRAALRAIKPSDISDGMVEAYLRAHGGSDESVKKALFMGVNDFRRALAAAIAAGAEQ